MPTSITRSRAPARAVRLLWSWRKDRVGEYRVRCRHVNGNKAWSSSEGYGRLADALRNADLFGAPVHSLRQVAANVLVETFVERRL